MDRKNVLVDTVKKIGILEYIGKIKQIIKPGETLDALVIYHLGRARSALLLGIAVAPLCWSALRAKTFNSYSQNKQKSNTPKEGRKIGENLIWE